MVMINMVDYLLYIVIILKIHLYKAYPICWFIFWIACQEIQHGFLKTLCRIFNFFSLKNTKKKEVNLKYEMNEQNMKLEAQMSLYRSPDITKSS